MGIESSFPIKWHCARGGVYGESVSVFHTHFNVSDVGIFSFAQCAGITQLLTGFFFSDIFSMCSCRFGVWMGASARVTECSHKKKKKRRKRRRKRGRRRREEEGKEAGKKNLDEFTSVTKINLKWIKTYM